VVDNVCAAVSEIEVSINAMKWHMRLGHVSSQGLMELKKQDVIKDLSQCDYGMCENCLLGKAKRVKFTKGIHRTHGILDYIHADLWGPTKNLSLGGAS